MDPSMLRRLLAPWLEPPHRRGAATYVLLASGLRALAADGRLPVGILLPSERRLAEALGLSRTTITAAYDRLRGEGYLASTQGSGSRIALPAAPPPHPDVAPGDAPDRWDLSVAALPAPEELLDAAALAGDSLARLVAGHGLHPMGLESLRGAVAAHLTRRGVATTASQVLITSGALHGWNLVLTALTMPGDRVLVEQPTYPAVIDALRARRVRPVVLPVTASGWEIRAGVRAARLAHVTPDGQNPTGLLADAEQRQELLAALAVEHVVADETFADLVLDGPMPPPLASLDGRVITLGSMSKSYWAGLRVGWVRAEGPVLGRLAQARAAIDLAGPVLEQLVALRLLDRAADILPGRRALLRRNRDALVEAIRSHLPWDVASPAAGMALWPRLGEGGATRLAAAALEAGVRIVPGPRFTVDGTADGRLRLPLTVPPERAADLVGVLVDASDRAALARWVPLGRQPGRWTA